MTFSGGPGDDLLVHLETPNPVDAAGDRICRGGDSVTAGIVARVRDASGAFVQSVSPKRINGIDKIAPSGDGNRLLFELTDGSVEVVDADSLQPVAPAFSPGALGSEPDPTDCFYNEYTLDRDGTRIAGTNSAGRAVVWAANGSVEIPAQDLDRDQLLLQRRLRLVSTLWNSVQMAHILPSEPSITAFSCTTSAHSRGIH